MKCNFCNNDSINHSIIVCKFCGAKVHVNSGSAVCEGCGKYWFESTIVAPVVHSPRVPEYISEPEIVEPIEEELEMEDPDDKKPFFRKR